MEPTDIKVIERFVRAEFGAGATAVNPVGAGMFSQAYSFEAGGEAYILRLNSFEEDFHKDRFAYQNFATPTLPIPKVLKIGRFDATRFYAISQRCQGQTFSQLEAETARQVLPQVFEVLDQIHRIDVGGYQGWGLTDTGGQGQFESWPGYLLSLYNQKFDFDRESLFQNTFLEREVFQTLWEALRQLCAYIPAQKYLVHGDYGFDNLMADRQRVTGVLDWAEMRLGDFVYDVAYLDFYSREIPYAARWREYLTTSGRVIPHLEDRLRCYTLHIGLSSLLIAAHLNDQADYEWCKQRSLTALQYPGGTKY